jgi:phosphoribosyl 1,2-cyclic phosphodiesterase
MGATLGASLRRVDVLLTHLHMDHIQGLGFFGPLYRPEVEVHIWGPASTQLGLKARLMRYLSPPLFPVCLRELPCGLHLHEVADAEVDIGEFRVASARVCHPGPTVGYRVRDSGNRTITYLPDHEPALGASAFPSLPRAWTSGGTLAEHSDLLIHDSQYSSDEYPRHVGWGHSSLRHVLDFGTLVGTQHLVLFHHDPSHSDVDLDRMSAEAIDEARPGYAVTPGREGMSFTL